MKHARWLLAAALPLACGGASKERRPTALHEMPAPEIARCVPGGAPPKGSLELDQLVTDQGDVPAAWVRAQKAQDAGALFRCATRLATDAKYAAQKTDSVRTSRQAAPASASTVQPRKTRSPAVGVRAFAVWCRANID